MIDKVGGGKSTAPAFFDHAERVDRFNSFGTSLCAICTKIIKI